MSDQITPTPEAPANPPAVNSDEQQVAASVPPQEPGSPEQGIQNTQDGTPPPEAPPEMVQVSKEELEKMKSESTAFNHILEATDVNPSAKKLINDISTGNLNASMPVTPEQPAAPVVPVAPPEKKAPIPQDFMPQGVNYDEHEAMYNAQSESFHAKVKWETADRNFRWEEQDNKRREEENAIHTARVQQQNFVTTALQVGRNLKLEDADIQQSIVGMVNLANSGNDGRNLTTDQMITEQLRGRYYDLFMKRDVAAAVEKLIVDGAVTPTDRFSTIMNSPPPAQQGAAPPGTPPPAKPESEMSEADKLANA